MESSTYPDKKVIAASRNFVNLVGHSETTHGTKEVVVGREKKKMCKAYPGIACEQHVKCYEASSKFEFEGGRIGMPVTIFCDPSGKELKEVGRKNSMGSSELIKKMDEATAKVPGEKIGYDAWNGARKLLADGDAAFEKEEYKKAIDAFAKVQKMKQKALKALGDEAMKRVEERGDARLKEAQEKIESDKEEAKKLLKKVAEQFKPLECAKKAADALKALEEKK